MNEKQDMTALIHKYLTSQATTEERRLVDAWMLESDENREMFEEIKLIWDNSEDEAIEVSDSEMEEGLLRLEESIAENIREEQQQTTGRFGSDSYRRGRYKNLAIIALVIVSTLSVWAFYAHLSLSGKEIMISGKGNILLPDSSEIFSNRATVVSFRQTLWKREIHLEGEAFFEVQRNERRPFVIHAGETTIKVLGTSFLVRAYPGEPVQVSVVSGNVAVLHKDQRVEIHTGEEVVVTENNELVKSHSIDPNLLAWKTGKLAFENSLVKEVLNELEKMFDVKFEVEDPQILKRRFTGEFENLRLEQILELITSSLHLSVGYLDNRHILLSEKLKL
jgi:ferric-dicitrate binding protein FerR (iron transport regulator)